eukprot:UN31705
MQTELQNQGATTTFEDVSQEATSVSTHADDENDGIITNEEDGGSDSGMSGGIIAMIVVLVVAVPICFISIYYFLYIKIYYENGQGLKMTARPFRILLDITKILDITKME